MTVSAKPAHLFVANPKASDVGVPDIDIRKLIAVAALGAEPNYVAITPDENLCARGERDVGGRGRDSTREHRTGRFRAVTQPGAGRFS